MKFEFSAGGIVYKKEKRQYYFCLILNPYDKWTFPKGKIEKQEKPEAAAKREVQEEIGLEKIEVKKLLDKIDYWYKRDNETIHKYVYFYLMEARGKQELIHQESEIADAQWFLASDVIEKLGYPKEDENTFRLALKELNVKVK